MGALAISDLTPMAGEPCVHDLRVAEALGFKRPRVIRELVERNKGELETYGPLAVRYGKSRGQAFTEFFLSEGQALVICALARTEKAAAVRRQLIEVFLAYRRGELASSDATVAVLRRIEARLDALESAGLRLDAVAQEPRGVALALTYAVDIWAGQVRMTRPKFWADVEVRGLVLTTHRQMTVDGARAVIVTRCGKERAPSRTSLHRFWMRLDKLKSANPSLRMH
jgi:hypothetical protein